MLESRKHRSRVCWSSRKGTVGLWGSASPECCCWPMSACRGMERQMVELLAELRRAGGGSLPAVLDAGEWESEAAGRAPISAAATARPFRFTFPGAHPHLRRHRIELIHAWAGCPRWRPAGRADLRVADHQRQHSQRPLRSPGATASVVSRRRCDLLVANSQAGSPHGLADHPRARVILNG